VPAPTVTRAAKSVLNSNCATSRSPQLLWVTLFMKEDIALYPVKIGLFRATIIVSSMNMINNML
jgi:hypothetical protein